MPEAGLNGAGTRMRFEHHIQCLAPIAHDVHYPRCAQPHMRTFTRIRLLVISTPS